MSQTQSNKLPSRSNVAYPSNNQTAKKHTRAMDVLIRIAYRKRTLAGITATSAAIGVLLSLLLPVRYTATAKIMPPQQTPSAATLLMNQLVTSGAGSIAAAASGGGFGLRNPNEIYLGLLHSRPVADAILRRFALASVYRARDLTDGRKELDKNTQIVSEKSGLIAISVTDRDKVRAAAIANAYANELRAVTQDLAVTEASQRRLFYERQLKQAKENLVSAEAAFQQIQQKKGLVALDAQSKATIESLSALRAKVAAKQVELHALRSYSTDRNPDVQLAEKELSALQFETSRLERRDTPPQFANLSLGDMSAAGLEYLHAQHEFLYQQTLYDLLIKQYDAARLDEAKQGAVIQVVEPAIPPDRKSFPRRGLIVLWFVMLGLIAAGAYVTAFEQARRNPELTEALADLKSALLGRAKA